MRALTAAAVIAKATIKVTDNMHAFVIYSIMLLNFVLLNLRKYPLFRTRDTI